MVQHQSRINGQQPWARPEGTLRKWRAGLKMGLSDSFGSCTHCCVYGCQVCSTVCRFGCEDRKDTIWITYCSDSISLSQSMLVSFWKTVLLLWTREMYLNEAITKRPEGRVWGALRGVQAVHSCDRRALGALLPPSNKPSKMPWVIKWRVTLWSPDLSVNDSLLPLQHALSEVGNHKEQFSKTRSYTNILWQVFLFLL